MLANGRQRTQVPTLGDCDPEVPLARREGMASPGVIQGCLLWKLYLYPLT